MDCTTDMFFFYLHHLYKSYIFPHILSFYLPLVVSSHFSFICSLVFTTFQFLLLLLLKNCWKILNFPAVHGPMGYDQNNFMLV